MYPYSLMHVFELAFDMHIGLVEDFHYLAIYTIVMR
jgi:hypothetical protein